LGVGHHIQVKTTAGKEYHGNIQAIESDLFTLLPDHQTAPVQIAFVEMQYVEQNLSNGAWIAIAVGVAAGVVVAILCLVSLSNQ
jgi:Holliday junction resolvasome RuvABC endonuclease subunit